MLQKFSQLNGSLEYAYDKLRIKYLIPFILLIIYTAAGAGVLYGLEGHREQEEKREFNRNYAFASDQIMKRLVEIKRDPGIQSDELIFNRTRDALDWYLRYIGVEEWIESRRNANGWTWWGAMFYCGTIYSTIGYGLPSPYTPSGRIFTCVYALVGIPLFLTILKEVGIHLSRLLRRTWKQGTRCIRKFRKKKNQSPAKSKSATGDLAAMESGKHSMPHTTGPDGKRRKSRLPFPIYFPLILVVLWILLCAGLFCAWERHWGFFTSVYFVFISLSTIGLGDVGSCLLTERKTVFNVPSKPDLMLANFILLMIGLALISMSFALIQIRIEELLEDMLQKFMEDFEKMGIGDGGKGDVDPGSLQSSKLKSKSPGWLTEHIAKAVAPRQRSPSISSSSETEEGPQPEEDKKQKTPIEEALEKWAAEQGGGSSVLLQRMMNTRQLHQLQHTIEERQKEYESVEVQTTNDLTDIIHFLDIPDLQTAATLELKQAHNNNNNNNDLTSSLQRGNSLLEDPQGIRAIDSSSASSLHKSSNQSLSIISNNSGVLMDIDDPEQKLKYLPPVKNDSSSTSNKNSKKAQKQLSPTNSPAPYSQLSSTKWASQLPVPKFLSGGPSPPSAPTVPKLSSLTAVIQPLLAPISPVFDQQNLTSRSGPPSGPGHHLDLPPPPTGPHPNYVPPPLPETFSASSFSTSKSMPKTHHNKSSRIEPSSDSPAVGDSELLLLHQRHQYHRRNNSNNNHFSSPSPTHRHSNASSAAADRMQKSPSQQQQQQQNKPSSKINRRRQHRTNQISSTPAAYSGENSSGPDDEHDHSIDNCHFESDRLIDNKPPSSKIIMPPLSVDQQKPPKIRQEGHYEDKVFRSLEQQLTKTPTTEEDIDGADDGEEREESSSVSHHIGLTTVSSATSEPPNNSNSNDHQQQQQQQQHPQSARSNGSTGTGTSSSGKNAILDFRALLDETKILNFNKSTDSVSSVNSRDFPAS